jgi:hypothetical protein
VKHARWTTILFACAACSKPAADAAPEGGLAVANTVAARAAADAAAAAPAKAAAPAAPATVPWSGTYTSTAGTLYIPEDWKSVRWTVPDTPAGLGDGTLSLTVDSATGRVTGTLAGPLGPATLAGFTADGKITATVARQDASDRGFAGTLVGTLSGDRGEGEIHVSLAEVSAVRTATFSLSRDGAGVAPTAASPSATAQPSR